MRGGLIFSIVFHAAILGWALFTIQSQPELRVPELEPLAVDLVTPGDVTKLRQGARNAKQLEAQAKETPKPDIAKKEADKPKPVAAAPPPPEPEPPAPKEPEKKADPIADKLAAVPPPPPPAPEPPAPAAPPPPAPGIEEQKKLDELMREQERQADEQRKAEEAKKAEEQKRLEEEKRQEEARKLAELKKKQEEAKKKKEAELKKKRDEEKKRKEAEAKRFDAEKMAALLNKIPDKGAPLPSSEPTEPTKNRGPALGAPEGRDRQLSASELAILAQLIKSCVQSKWNVMGGGEGAQHTLVKIRLRFNPDGRLATAPTIMNPQTTPFFLAVSDSAIRAVQACEPFPLPPAKYEIWKDIVLNFDPRDMF